MRVPAMTDVLQEDKKLDVPEIRVWCHPPKVGESGSDYYMVFDTFRDALRYIGITEEAEDHPLLAFGGYELNLWEMEPVLIDEKAILDTAKKLADCNVLVDTCGTATVYLKTEFFHELMKALETAGADVEYWRKAGKGKE